MRFSESEIVEDILEHIRQAGGEFREWRVGTAQDKGIRCQVSGVSEQDAESLIHREAYTTFAAEEVVERLAGFGLQPERHTTSNPAATAHPSKTVCVYRPGKEVVSRQLSVVSKDAEKHAISPQLSAVSKSAA